MESGAKQKDVRLLLADRERDVQRARWQRLTRLVQSQRRRGKGPRKTLLDVGPPSFCFQTGLRIRGLGFLGLLCCSLLCLARFGQNLGGSTFLQLGLDVSPSKKLGNAGS